MTQPASIQRQLDEGEALRKQAYEPAEQPAEAEKTEETQPAEEPPKPQEPTEIRDVAYWRHRFEVMDGKYRAEVPALRQEIKDLKHQLEQSSAEDLDSKILKELPKSFLEDYGDELPKVIAQIVKGMQPEKPPENNDLESVKSELEQMREDRQANMMADLTASVPNWEALQNSSHGKQWLMQYDSQTGQQRNALLQEAASKFQTQKVINMFRQMEQAATPNQPPESAIQPPQSRATTQTPAGGKTYTRADITDFYRDLSQGKYTEEKGREIEADIFRAQNEGRIVG